MPRRGTSAGGDKYPGHGHKEAVTTQYQETKRFYTRDLVKLAKAMENPPGGCAIEHSAFSLSNACVYYCCLGAYCRHRSASLV